MRDERTDELRGMAGLWYYLSQVFITVPDKSILPFTAELLGVLEEMLKEGGQAPLARQAADELKLFLTQAEGLNDTELEDKLNRDYTFLFLMGRGCVPLSESVWISPSGLEMQEPREEVYTAYEDWGFEKPPTCKEPEDQFGVEMLFLASMARTAAERLEAGEDISRAERFTAKFISEHPARWAAHFAAGIRTRMQSEGAQEVLPLYIGAALLAQFLLTELPFSED